MASRVRLGSVLPWLVALLGLLAAGWDFWSTGGGQVAWVALGLSGGIAVVLATHLCLGRAPGGKRSTEEAPRALRHPARARTTGRAMPAVPENPLASTADAMEVSSELPSASETPPTPSDDPNLKHLLEGMLAEGRYALLLRPQIAVNLSARVAL